MEMSAFYPEFPVLIVDDEQVVLVGMNAALSSAGMNNIITCQDSRKVMAMLGSRHVEVLLLDLTMPFVSGQELLPKVRETYPELPVIIVTGMSEVNTAVECMKAGVFDYLVKAVEKSKLIATVSRAIQIRQLQRENSLLSHYLVDRELERPECFAEIVTRDDRMRALLVYVESIARTAQPVLITGETGVGKELFARALHRSSGREGEMVSVNIAGLEEQLFADTLFGHLRGAFTGADQARKGLIERASGGTLFLDEIGDLNHPAQVRLLRLLESREYYPLGSDAARKSDARIVVATNRDLSEETRVGRFRMDLYYRLCTHHVAIPPLRERPEDVMLLAERALGEAAHSLGKGVPGISREAAAALERYHFPGNVRELKAMIFDAVSRHRGSELDAAAFRDSLGGSDISEAPMDGGEALSFPPGFPTLRQATEFLVSMALKRTGGNQAKAARLLGISPQALSKRLKGAEKA